MNGDASRGNDRFQFGKLFQYFLQGLLVIAPFAITLYTVYWIVSSVDSIIPFFTAKGADGQVYVRNYGLGFLAVLLIITVIGWFSSHFLKNRAFSLFDTLLTRTPGISFIYSTVKDFFEAFAGEKKKFNKPVLANIDDNDVWRVGFITQESCDELGLADYVAVYVPMSYSIAGNVYLIPGTRIKPITGISAADAMKFAISGGITHIDDERTQLSEEEMKNTPV